MTQTSKHDPIPDTSASTAPGGGAAGVRDRELVLDIAGIRARAQTNMDEGPVTQAYRANREAILKLLSDSLATELVCVLRYRRHYYMLPVVGAIEGHAVADEIWDHSTEELEHADRFAERIVQLGGEPDFNPGSFAGRTHSEYGSARDLQSMLMEDLVAERVVIETYTQIIQYIGSTDVTTRRIFERVLKEEEEHADEVADFLGRMKGQPASRH
jgi:bacterioferritin